MLNSKGFDKWAGEYDDSISRFSEGYPFEGYYDVLSYIHTRIDEIKNKHILDLGVGTGLLSHELYKKGAFIYGLDFSEKMIKLAKGKMPKANFYKFDLKNGLPGELSNIEFNYIISSYALHHLNDQEKILLINRLIKQLKDGGKIIIGDIAFMTLEDKEKCRKDAKDKWDEDEIYIVANELQTQLSMFRTKYTQISICAGVLEILVDGTSDNTVFPFQAYEKETKHPLSKCKH